jgi:hypothetical protein
MVMSPEQWLEKNVDANASSQPASFLIPEGSFTCDLESVEYGMVGEENPVPILLLNFITTNPVQGLQVGKRWDLSQSSTRNGVTRHWQLQDAISFINLLSYKEPLLVVDRKAMKENLGKYTSNLIETLSKTKKIVGVQLQNKHRSYTSQGQNRTTNDVSVIIPSSTYNPDGSPPVSTNGPQVGDVFGDGVVTSRKGSQIEIRTKSGDTKVMTI